MSLRFLISPIPASQQPNSTPHLPPTAVDPTPKLPTLFEIFLHETPADTMQRDTKTSNAGFKDAKEEPPKRRYYCNNCGNCSREDKEIGQMCWWCEDGKCGGSDSD